MELYIVEFYDQNESGNDGHTELYSSYNAAFRRFNALKDHLNCYSWVYLWNTKCAFGRIMRDTVLDSCNSCNGADDYYHGDTVDF